VQPERERQNSDVLASHGYGGGRREKRFVIISLLDGLRGLVSVSISKGCDIQHSTAETTATTPATATIFNHGATVVGRTAAAADCRPSAVSEPRRTTVQQVLQHDERVRGNGTVIAERSDRTTSAEHVQAQGIGDTGESVAGVRNRCRWRGRHR